MNIPADVARWYERLKARELVCPACKGDLLKGVRGGNYGFGVASCSKCGYQVEIYDLTLLTWSRPLERPREPIRWLLECPEGHKGYLKVLSASPRSHQVVCLAPRDPEKPSMALCRWEDTKAFGPFERGFENGAKMNKSFVSKALTLFTIAVGRGRYSRSRVAEVSNLPVTKIDGTLARAFKTRCAERSAGRVRVPPSGLAVLYRITPLGIDNLRWFLKAGLISSGEYDVEVVLRNARSSQPGVRWLRRE